MKSDARLTGFVDVDGARLHFEVAGQGHPLVLMHAGIADSRMWDDQIDAFARHFMTIRYDRRGHGRTVSTPVPFSHLEDLRRILRHVGAPAAHVVGASYGGLIAIDTALESPEMVTALVLVAPSVSGHRGPARPIAAEVEAAEARGDLAGAVELELQLWVDGPRRRPDQVNSAVREKVRIMNTLAFEKASEAGADRSPDRPAIARLADVRAPVLLVAGDQELADRIALVEDLARQIHGARKVTIPGGAHMVTMEQPEPFTRVALEFLVNAPPTGT